MGQKDISEKTFIALNDVFADIFNVLVFGGKQLMKEEALSDQRLRIILQRCILKKSMCRTIR